MDKKELNSLNVIFYDGECALCNEVVWAILHQDPEGIFHFLSLQSERAQQYLRGMGISEVMLDTFYLSLNEKVFERSDAVIEILKLLPKRSLQLLAQVLRSIPKPLRDWGYDRIAQSRHRLQAPQCRLPTEQYQSRVLG